MKKNNFLIYGSYGYTGKLIAKLAIEQGFHPVLGGRNQEKLTAQANELHLQHRVFDVNDLQATKEVLKEFVCVVHCAGPFINTYKNMVEACLETQTHYLDITGEVEVIENLAKLNSRAQAANIMVLPGAGFDVVPSDCLAQHLKSRLPDATDLTLAIKASGAGSSDPAFSRGTAKTMLNGLSSGSMVRDAGVLKSVPLGWKKRAFNFGERQETTCITIAWGDLASAWWSTRIPHIETYMAVPNKLALIFKLINPIKWIFKWNTFQEYMEKQINKMPEGPSDEMRTNSSSQIYGEVKNAQGKKITALLKTPNGYDLTASTVLLIVNKILADNAPRGFQTPSTAYGKDLVLEIAHVVREEGD